MRIQSKARPRRAIKLALEPGSLLLMAGAAQEHWEHGIPKTREPVGARISLAFRQRPRANETA
jgi:alkylated DNA repair dioxygenase AlkB